MSRDTERSGSVFRSARVLAGMFGRDGIDEKDRRARSELSGRDAGVVRHSLGVFHVVRTERPADLHGQIALAHNAVGLNVCAGCGVILVAETQR